VRERSVTLAACLALVACGKGGGRTRDGGVDSATRSAAASPSAAVSPSPPGPPSGTLRGDASSGCRAIRGPIELPIRGPAALSVRGDVVDAVLDDNGRPRVLSFPVAAISASASAVREPLEGGSTAGMSVPCAVAGDRVFCPDKSGGVHRTTRDGADDRVVASTRSGTPVAAAAIGRTHALVSYLASRRTSEGMVKEAWIGVDDEAPVRLSEDGSGATAVALSPRGASVLAIIVDARAALTAVHVRPLTYDGRLRVGEDAVVFVGGPGERHTAGALAIPAAGPAWALVPIGQDVRTFGLAMVRVDDPPRVDEPSSWSIYPNGIDPSPIAATAGARMWVVRARPQAAEPSSPRVLEVGDLDAEGAFASHDTVAVSGAPTHVAAVADGRGGLWISWVDGSGSWIERLACK